MEADKEEFIKKFTESFGRLHNYKPSDSDLEHIRRCYIKANAKSKVDYKVKTYLPDYAVFMLDQKQSTWITWMFMNWVVNST